MRLPLLSLILNVLLLPRLLRFLNECIDPIFFYAHTTKNHIQEFTTHTTQIQKHKNDHVTSYGDVQQWQKKLFLFSEKYIIIMDLSLVRSLKTFFVLFLAYLVCACVYTYVCIKQWQMCNRQGMCCVMRFCLQKKNLKFIADSYPILCDHQNSLLLWLYMQL